MKRHIERILRLSLIAALFALTATPVLATACDDAGAQGYHNCTGWAFNSGNVITPAEDADCRSLGGDIATACYLANKTPQLISFCSMTYEFYVFSDATVDPPFEATDASGEPTFEQKECNKWKGNTQGGSSQDYREALFYCGYDDVLLLESNDSCG